MNARVRSPGSSAADTASATVRRVSRLGSCRRLRATSSGTSCSSTGTRSAATSSPNSRAQALSAEIVFSARIVSSGSESRCGR